MRIARLLIAGLLITSTWSAGCAGNDNPNKPSPTVTSVAVSGTLNFTSAGQTSPLTATATLSDGTTQNVTTVSTWQSSNGVMATVSASGVVTASNFGQSLITATYQGVTGQATIVFPVNLNGQTWKGTTIDSSGTLQLTMVFTQTGAAISGSVTYTGVGVAGTGTFTGTVAATNDSVNFTIAGAQSGCTIAVTGTATVTTSVLSGSYTGTNSCIGPLTNGQVSMLKQ